jgi:uncharacterized membrane protein YdjX (TVP38/TMEM64 family)
LGSPAGTSAGARTLGRGMTAAAETSKAAPGWRKPLWLIVAAVALALLVAAWLLLPLAEWMAAYGAYARGFGAAGVVVVCIVYVVATLLCVPGWPLTLLVTFAYGWWAIPISLGGGMAAALIAFLIGRSVAKRAVERFVARHEALKAVHGIAREEAFKTILLTRLTPVTPFAIENYVFGGTGVRLLPYLAATSVGIIPGTIQNVWLGMIGRTAAEGGASVLAWGVLALGFAASIGLSVWMTRAARRRMREERDRRGDRG